ncbi:MAG: fructose-bisphosphatase class II family protein [Anaerolineae bacterium]|nr:fructose-bisphosphatase class II family protein [Anaerolineae bacterium]
MTEMPSRNLGLDLVRVTEAAALAAGRWMGLGRRQEADQAATAAAIDTLQAMDVVGCAVVNGEAGGSHVMMLCNMVPDRETTLDVLSDPIDGAALLAYGYPGAIAVIAAAPSGAFHQQSAATYMEKLVVNAAVSQALVPECLDAPAAWTLALIARALDKRVGNLTVFVLDRPRHADLIREVRATGAHVVLRAEGDITGALMAVTRESGIDALMGIGGYTEGLISACAIKAMGGAMLARLAPQSRGELTRLQEVGLDVGAIMTSDELVEGEIVFFAATGITDGPLLSGVRYRGNRATSNSMVLRGETRTRRIIHAEHLLRETV